MKQKFIKETYLKHVKEYEIKFGETEEYYATVKLIKQVEKRFMASNNLCLIDDGYYILELIPKNENYLIRAFFDKEKNLLEYYIDVIKSSGMDLESNLPYYMDLYNDLVVTNEDIEIWDQDELEMALKEGKITEDDFELAQDTTKRLVREIQHKKNKYINMELNKLL